MLADHCGALGSGGLEFPEVIAAFALAAKFCGLLLPLVCWIIIAVPLQAAGWSSPEVIAVIAIAERSALAADMASATACASAPIVATLSLSVTVVPLQAAGLSSPEVLAAVAIAVRFALAAEMASVTACASTPIVAALFPSVAALPLQSACLSSRAVDLGCWFSALQSVSRISQVGRH